MTPIEQAIREILPIKKWNHDERKVWKDGIDIEVCRHDCRRCQIESLIPALVEVFNAALAQRTREAAATKCSLCGSANEASFDGKYWTHKGKNENDPILCPAYKILALIQPDESTTEEKQP